MERRFTRRSSILRTASQCDGSEPTESGDGVATGRENAGSVDGCEFTSVTTTTISRRSMKRVSFASNIKEVRFYEKDIHGSPSDKVPPLNRVMPAEGTDAHHSLLNDPIKLASSGAPLTPNRMDITDVNSFVPFDENTDPRFVPDDTEDSEESVFEKSAYISMGDSEDCENEAGNLPNSSDMSLMEDVDMEIPSTNETPPLDTMQLADMEASMLFIRTPKSNQAGATEVVGVSSANDSSFQDSLLLPDASTRLHLGDEDRRNSAREASRSAMRADPVAGPSVRTLRMSERRCSSDFAKKRPLVDESGSEDMDISSVISIPGHSISAIQQSPFAPVSAKHPQGFLTSTMVASGQKCRPRDETSERGESGWQSSSSLKPGADNMSHPPKRARTEIPGARAGRGIETGAGPVRESHRGLRRLAVHHISDSEGLESRPKPKYDDMPAVFARLENGNQPCGITLPPRQSFRRSAPQDVDFNDVLESVLAINEGPSGANQPEPRVLSELEAFKTRYSAEKEKVCGGESRRESSAPSNGREIRGGHLLETWWLENVGFSMHGYRAVWGGTQRRLRMRNSSWHGIEDFLAGKSNGVDFVEIVLPEECGLLRISFGEPFLTNGNSGKTRALHFDITGYQLIPRPPFEKWRNDENYINRHALGCSALETLWNHCRSEFSKIKTTEKWQTTLMARVTKWVEMASQFFSDVDNCYARLPPVRLSFPARGVVHIDVDVPGCSGSFSTDVHLPFDRPFPDCAVSVEEIKYANVGLERAIGNRIRDEMSAAFRNRQGLFGMCSVLVQQATRFKSAALLRRVDPVM